MATTKKTKKIFCDFFSLDRAARKGSDESDKPGKSDQSDMSDMSDKSDQSDNSDNSDQSGQSGQPDNSAITSPSTLPFPVKHPCAIA